jgi:antitoxin component HigA of HigAB toxin-antitoxin module
MSTHQLKPIRTDAEHRAALKRIDDLLAAAPGTPEADEFEALTILVNAYEDEAIPIDRDLDPISFLINAMEQLGYTQTDLSELLGSRSHASEILSGRRPLSLNQIRKIASAWNLPTDPLVGVRSARVA